MTTKRTMFRSGIRDVEVGLPGNGTDGRELVACHLDVRHPRIGERFQTGIVIGAGVAERDEGGRARRWFHGCTLGPIKRTLARERTSHDTLMIRVRLETAVTEARR